MDAAGKREQSGTRRLSLVSSTVTEREDDSHKESDKKQRCCKVAVKDSSDFLL
jgi:hypothetical protein